MIKKYETVIGLEVHVELSTATKIFCGCRTDFGGAQNSHTCPVCTGMPGALPVLNKKVVEYAMALGLATGCEISRYTRFDRKNYFYPDNPQNYQISQLYLPICRNGSITIATKDGEKIIRIHEMHMEEDAGKLIHDDNGENSLIDYNRSGVPLIEIVSEPDMKNAAEAIAYIEKLRMICRYLGISDCKLNEGSMRADVNLSVRKTGSSILGIRTEMKNLNSFKAIAHAIENEKERQIKLLESGGEVVQETRRWDENKGQSFAMRSKEDAKDYRYFPEPDLLPVIISNEWIDKIKEGQPEFKNEKAERFKKEYNLSDYDADIMTQSRHMAEIFEETAKLSGKPKKAANWFMGDTLRILKEKAMDAEELSFSPKHLAALIQAVDNGKINQANAQKVFEKIFDEDVEPVEYMNTHGLVMLSDTSVIDKAIDEMLSENARIVEEYRSGRDKVYGFLVGQAMKKLKGMADPAKINEILKDRLQK